MFLAMCNRFTPRSVFVFTVFWMRFPIRAAMRTFLGQPISEQNQPQEFGNTEDSQVVVPSVLEQFYGACPTCWDGVSRVFLGLLAYLRP